MIKTHSMQPYNPKAKHDLGEGLKKSFPIRYAEVGAKRDGLKKFPIVHVDGKDQTPPPHLILVMSTLCACGLLMMLAAVLG